MRRLESDYRPLRGAILIWIPLMLFVCAVIWYRITQ